MSIKNCSVTIGNRTLDLVEQCLNQLRHRVPLGEVSTLLNLTTVIGNFTMKDIMNIEIGGVAQTV